MAEQRIERVTVKALASFGLAVLQKMIGREAWQDYDGWQLCELAVKHGCAERRIVDENGEVDGQIMEDCDPGDEVVLFDPDHWPNLSLAFVVETDAAVPYGTIRLVNDKGKEMARIENMGS